MRALPRHHLTHTALRGNSPSFDLYLRPAVRRGQRLASPSISLVRKSDARLLAEGALHLRPRALELTLSPSANTLALSTLARELAPLLRRLYPRCRLHIRIVGKVSCWRKAPLDLQSHRLAQIVNGIASDYGASRGLTRVREPQWLVSIGLDHAKREAWLVPAAARAFAQMRAAAQADGVALEIVSAFRSAHYQARIVAAKLERGQSLAQILKVNAAPGYSEHLSGRALDLGTPGCAPAQTQFEHTDAFAWLCAHAGKHGFRLSYPRGNPHGIDYEPWHWYWPAR